MSNASSLTKANYALAVLKVARTSDRRTAAQLVEGLAADFPELDDSPDVAAAHRQAIEILGRLTDSIRGTGGMHSTLWEPAAAAVEHWRSKLL